ncbi:hypothetical protein GPECTOR_692g833 [Gonium pectorale]|uniref:Reverse transcriptase Ty1/copia-type domain-containing protein n=1 Tax=Gonium pectorale TaxID=33097 RepID=A0A150FU80_GONPE|nr:hypothetical protein GPECTOR_692g833 [Gonium pectorale]|eukprot:KXZ41172.1 hypothetical protein GPECTOR_692g833 [Gonium pectorale]
MPAGVEQPALPDGSDYRALVGELMFLATSTRPDIAQAVNALTPYMAAPTKAHMSYALGVLRYVAGTRDKGLQFGGGDAANFVGYSDSDWAGDPSTRRSTTGITSVRSKHIDVHHHLVRERVARGELKLEYCATQHIVADVLTKALGEAKFRACRNAMGVT